MKSAFLTLTLLAGTTLAVLLAAQPLPTPSANPPPVVAPQAATRPRIDVVFALDTTGSMGGLIQTAKEKIWSIAGSLSQAQPAPEIRIGLVAYRDRGDAYVTQVTDLSTDLDSVYAKLMDFQADGGGDGPESVNQALYDAIHRINWSQDANAYKVVFLVGDAPPHTDYRDDVPFSASLKAAQQRGIVVNTIQCGLDQTTTANWQQIAGLGNGRYFQVEQAGGGIALATPYDAKLAELSAKLDNTRLYYGSEAEQREKSAKLDATRKLHAEASVESRARRATFNSSASGAENLLGKNELLQDLKSGKADLAKIAPAELPKPLQSLAPAEQKAYVEKVEQERQQLQGEIAGLARQRGEYLSREAAKAPAAKDSLDQKIYETVRGQSKDKGLRYEADAPAL